MSQENGGTDPLIHAYGQRWLPIEQFYWRSFRKDYPAYAESVWNAARTALWGT